MDEKAIEAAGRAICIAAGYEPEEWADNEVLRDRCIKYARVALNTLSPGSTGSAEGMVRVPRDLVERAQHQLSASPFPFDRDVASELSAMLSAAGGRDE